MTASEQATHEFAAQSTSPAASRRFVRQTLSDWGAHSILDDAVLLTNELVTNAVVHAGTALSVSCALGSGYVQIGVSDSHAARALPTEVSNAPEEKTSGRGLYLLSQIAEAWGVEYDRAGKRVWFRLPLTDEAPYTEVTPQPTHFVDLGVADAPVRVAVVETDPAGSVGHWSFEAEQLLGWPAAEMQGRALADLVASTAPGAEQPTFAAALALPRWRGECSLRTAHGEEIRVYLSQVHASAGDQPRVVVLLVPAEHRGVLLHESAAVAGPTEPSAPVPSRPGLLPLESLLGLAVEHSRDLLDGDVAYALLVTDDDLEVELRAATSSEGLPPVGTRWRKPANLSGLSGAAGELPEGRVYADLAEHPMPEQFLGDAGMHALTTAPLRVGERVIGRVGVAAQPRGVFTGDDAARLQHSVDRFSLAIESARLNELERARRGRLSYLAEASDLLAGVLDPDMAAALTAQLVVPRLADWCAVYLSDQRRTQRLACVWHAREEALDPLRGLLVRLPAPALEESGHPRPWPALRGLVAELTHDLGESQLVDGPAVTVSLLARGRAIGTLVAGRRAGQQFRSGAVETLDDLCRRAAWALDNARLYRERSTISAALQRSLLPSGLPDIPTLDLGIAYEAAGEGIDVGGDFYDVFAIDRTRWGFVIGDVCGKGAEAAAVAGLARHSLRVLARENQGVPRVLQRLNATILADGDATRFVTLVYGELSLADDGGVTVTLAAAGHPLPMLVDDDGELHTVGRPQVLLGVLPDPTFRTDTLGLRQGQHLVITTDGVVDRRSGRRDLGERGLHAVLRQSARLPAPAVAARVRRAVLDFSPEPLQDDFAVLVLQPVGGSPGRGR